MIFGNKMARKVPKTKAGKKSKIHRVLKEFKDRVLSIGKSKKKVKSRKQAIAIALSSTGLSKENKESKKEEKEEK